MTFRLDNEDLNILAKSWPKIRKIATKLIKSKAQDKIDAKSCIPMTFNKDLVLGHGKWGVVLGLPSLDEIVIKITTDPFEWFLIEMLMQDDELRTHPAIPYIIGTAVLDIFQDELPCYLIVRENLKIGVPLPTSSPLLKMRDMLLQDFVDPMEEIEHELSQILKYKQDLNLLHITTTYSLVAGEIKKQVSKIKTRIPKVNKSSKFYWVIDFQKKLLNKGIALVDIHPNNLGTREFDITEIFEHDRDSIMDCVVISDLGMAYGTPIFLQSGMAYNNFDAMMDHFVKILKEYTEEQKTFYARSNPMYSVDFIKEEIRSCCSNANHYVSNILVDSSGHQEIHRVVGKILFMIPKMHISAESITLTIKNEISSLIQEWIEADIILDETSTGLDLKCYVDDISNGLVKCRVTTELSYEDTAPIAKFHIPKNHSLYQKLKVNLEKSSERGARKTQNTFIQYIPEALLVEMNGVPYEKI